MDDELRAQLSERGRIVPRRFGRNQVKNLCRRKGYRLVRYWEKFYKQWFYRTVPITRRIGPGKVGLDYCNTHISALERVFVHMLGKPDIPYYTRQKATQSRSDT